MSGNTHEQYFLNSISDDNKKDYILAHYDLEICFRSMIDKDVTSTVIGRIRNALVETINHFILLPKAILVVLDDNILDDLDHYDTGISLALGKLMEWITGEFHKIINDHKKVLPSMSRKFRYPTVLWCLIPKHEIYVHYNDFKDKFNTAAVKAANNYREMGGPYTIGLEPKES